MGAYDPGALFDEVLTEAVMQLPTPGQRLAAHVTLMRLYADTFDASDPAEAVARVVVHGQANALEQQADVCIAEEGGDW